MALLAVAIDSIKDEKSMRVDLSLIDISGQLQITFTFVHSESEFPTLKRKI
jgi:hypothetical protein